MKWEQKHTWAEQGKRRDTSSSETEEVLGKQSKRTEPEIYIVIPILKSGRERELFRKSKSFPGNKPLIESPQILLECAPQCPDRQHTPRDRKESELTHICIWLSLAWHKDQHTEDPNKCY